MPPFTASRFLVVLAMVIFVCAAFGVNLGGLGLVPIGLAVYMASHLVVP